MRVKAAKYEVINWQDVESDWCCTAQGDQHSAENLYESLVMVTTSTFTELAENIFDTPFIAHIHNLKNVSCGH